MDAGPVSPKAFRRIGTIFLVPRTLTRDVVVIYDNGGSGVPPRNTRMADYRGSRPDGALSSPVVLQAYGDRVAAWRAATRPCAVLVTTMTRRLRPGWLSTFRVAVIAASTWMPWLTTTVGGGGWVNAISTHGSLELPHGFAWSA